MTFDQITKVVELAFTFLGLVLVFFGIVLPLKQNAKDAAAREKELAEKKEAKEKEKAEKKEAKEKEEAARQKVLAEKKEAKEKEKAEKKEAKEKEEAARKDAEEQRKREESAFRRVQWEKELVDRQISELYGPLNELLLEKRKYFELVEYQLGRKKIFDSVHPTLDSFPENEKKIWIHYVDTYQIPFQKKIIELLRKNQHLWYKSEPPCCYETYVEYILGIDMLDNQMRSGVPNYYEYHYCYNYPYQFDDYVSNTLIELRKRQEELLNCL